MGGQIVNATVIEARWPRLTQAEKGHPQGGGRHAEWKPARRAQICRDGRWTLKRGRKRRAPPDKSQKRQPEIAVPTFGYKNHVGVYANTASCGAMSSPKRPVMTVVSSAPCSTASTPHRVAIQPTAEAWPRPEIQPDTSNYAICRWRYRSTSLGPSTSLNAHRQRKLVGHETSLSRAGRGRKSAQTSRDRIRLGVRIDPSARSSGGRYHRLHPFQPRTGFPLRRLRSSARIEA